MSLASVSAAVAPNAKRRRGRGGGRRRAWRGYLFIAPAVGLFLLMGLYPLGYGFVLSFVEWNGVNPFWTWVGVDNYREVTGGDPFTAPLLGRALRNTSVLLVALPVLVVAISLPLAVALNGLRRLRGTLRTVFFLPYVTSGIAVFYAWKFIFTPDGVLNSFLDGVGLDSLIQADGFLGNEQTSLAGVIVVLVWVIVPFAMLLYLASLQTLDMSILEAARLDGATAFQRIRFVIWPLLRPTTALIVAVTARAALQDFQTILLLTNGGPLGSSTTLSFAAYQFAFGDNPRYGLASALGWLLLLAGVLISLATFAVLRKRT